MRLITEAQLKEHLELTLSDRELVERIIGELTSGGNPDEIEKQVVRAYLVQELDDNIINDQLREDLSGEAAAFLDGWKAGLEYVRDEVIEPVCAGCGRPLVIPQRLDYVEIEGKRCCMNCCSLPEVKP